MRLEIVCDTLEENPLAALALALMAANPVVRLPLRTALS
ncbi:MAG: hypothetical protein ACI9N0_000240 [Ilumatobacter sp.]|jgi:hypothetical protein